LYKNLYWKVIYVYSYESNFQDKSILYDFHIFKLNNLKVIHDLYSQCLTQTLSKTTSNREPEGVYDELLQTASPSLQEYEVLHLKLLVRQLGG
jgi:hypothetical protein